MKQLIKRHAGKVALLSLALLAIFAIALADDYVRTLTVRNNILLDGYIADTSSFGLVAGTAQFTKSIYTGGASTDMYFVTLRTDSSAQWFTREDGASANDSTIYVAALAKSDSLVVVRSDTAFKQMKFSWLRLKQAAAR